MTKIKKLQRYSVNWIEFTHNQTSTYAYSEDEAKDKIAKEIDDLRPIYQHGDIKDRDIFYGDVLPIRD